MGVIDITPRRVSLGNLPGVRQVNTDTGAGLRSAAGAQLGRAVAGFGMELNRTANALEERRQRNAAWDYINKFQAAMRADDEEAAKTGIGEGEDPEKWVEGRIKRRGEIEKQVAKETGIDKKSLALAERHLAGFNLSTQSKWAARALSVTKGRELNAAKTAVDNAGTVLLDAMDSEDEGARMAALASWDEALANLAGQDETLGSDGIDALRRTKTEELLRSSLARKLETLTAISETQTSKEVEQTFHDFLQKFADDGTKALVNGTFKGADGFEDDLVERDTRGMDEKAFDLAARRDIETARQKAVARAERRDLDEVEAVLNEGVVAASTVRNADGSEPDDRVQAIESVMTRAEELARTKPKGSQAAAKAAAGVDHLDKLADQVAQFEIMNDLANGVELTKDRGKTSIYAKDTRKGKLFPKVYAAFEKKAFGASHEQNLLKIRGAMIDYAAENNPQGFYNFLAQAVVDKHITPGDFTRLRNEFTEGWMKRFKAAPEQIARQSSMAKKMLKAMNDKLGVDLSVAIKTDDYGDPAVRNGMLDWNDKVELPDASVGREFQKIVRRGDLFMGQGTRTATRKETIEGEMLKKAINEAMTLWSLNGLKIGYDPVTGEKLPEGQTHEVNVVEDFNALLDRLVNEKNVRTAADELKRQSSGYMTNVRLYGETEEQGRRARMTDSKPITDNQDETEEK